MTMPGSSNDVLKLELKRLIVEACERDISPEFIADEAPLVGMHSALGLDSLDVLQLNTALLKRYGVRIEDGKHARRVMKTINTLADFIEP